MSEWREIGGLTTTRTELIQTVRRMGTTSQCLAVRLAKNAGDAPSRPLSLPANTATGGEIQLNPLGLTITVEEFYGP